MQFLASLIAVLLLVLLTWFLGFRQPAKLESESEAQELFRLAPGGFEPVSLAIDTDGAAAIARDRDGQVALLVPHGHHFAVRPLRPGAQIIAQEGSLRIAEMQKLQLHLGESAGDWTGDWATTDIDANNA